MHKVCAAFGFGLAVLFAATTAHAAGPVDGTIIARSIDEDIALLRDTQDVFRAVAAALRPSLVRIETVGGSQPPQQFISVEGEDESAKRRRRSQNTFRDAPGSSFHVADGPTTGIVYSTDGYIITSSFNFVRQPILITVALFDGRRLVADLVARDQVRKIALLKVNATDLPLPVWRDVHDLDVGQWAIALGLGFGGEEPSITVGIVSALSRMHDNAVQADAKLNPANYGGPLCDIHGRIIGICVPMAQRPGELAGIELYDSGVGFAVPKHRVDEIVSVLKTGRSFFRGWLGISVNRRFKGAVMIVNVADPSPMQRAGVQPGDKILEANGKEIRNFGDLMQTLYMLPAGEQVELLMEAEESGYRIQVTLARSADLGSLPDLSEPLDPSEPAPGPDDK